MRKVILLAVIGLFSLSYAGDDPILDYYKPIQSDSLDKRVSYIESTFNAKIENLIEQIKSIQNKQSDYENAMKYMAIQTKKEIEELKTQVGTLTEEVSKLKSEKTSVSAEQSKQVSFCTTNDTIGITNSKRKLIVRVDKGTELEVLKETKKDYKVKYKGKVGYVSKKYCDLGG
jgi:polyhydroxyalkanoate synthesis regulator phasin